MATRRRCCATSTGRSSPATRIGLLGPTAPASRRCCKRDRGRAPAARRRSGTTAQGLAHRLLRAAPGRAAASGESRRCGTCGSIEPAGARAGSARLPRRLRFSRRHACSRRSARFSGGEKARLTLALLVRQRPNLLLLDEPTNHLDIEMREALTEALQDYDGALVVVAHDRHLLRATTDELWLVADGARRAVRRRSRRLPRLGARPRARKAPRRASQRRERPASRSQGAKARRGRSAAASFGAPQAAAGQAGAASKPSSSAFGREAARSTPGSPPRRRTPKRIASA